jgi:pimeloyl-ACP methyl ester carboxylesterase
MDFPGFGGSDASVSGRSVPDFADMAWGFLDVLDVREPVVLVGHHTGAKVAVEMAATVPARVKALVLAGLPYYENPTDRARRWSAKQVEPMVPDAAGSHLLREWKRLQGDSLDSSPELLNRELADTITASRYDLTYGETFPFDVGPLLPRLRCRALVLAGEKDVISAKAQQSAVNMMSAGQLQTVPQGGVFMMDEAARDVGRRILEFLESA